MSETPADQLLLNVVMRPIKRLAPVRGSLPYATHEGELEIGGTVLKVFQLSDGRRVIEAESLARFFWERPEG